MARELHATQTETAREIARFLFERGFDFGGINTLVNQLSCGRMTVYGWFKDARGIMLAGVEQASDDLLEALKRFCDGERQKHAANAGAGAGGGADLARAAFFQYCRLLEDPNACGTIVLRATLLSSRRNQKGDSLDLGRKAESLVLRHARFLAKVLEESGYDQAAARSRLLVAAATGLMLTPRGLQPDNPFQIPAVFFEAVTKAPLADSGKPKR